MRRVSVTCRCWPFTWHPTTMSASPCRRRAVVVRVRCRLIRRDVWPLPRPPKAYWCTTTRNRPTRTAWASSLKIRYRPPRPLLCRRRHRCHHRSRRPKGPRRSSSHCYSGPKAMVRYLTTLEPADGLRVSASRVICTSSTTILRVVRRFRFVPRTRIFKRTPTRS